MIASMAKQTKESSPENKLQNIKRTTGKCRGTTHNVDWQLISVQNKNGATMMEKTLNADLYEYEIIL